VPTSSTRPDPAEVIFGRDLIETVGFPTLKALGWDQTLIATEIGVSPTAVNHWARGRSVPSARHSAAFAELFRRETGLVDTAA
jgi:DNA-binding XRE family transcriptional regulator